MDGVGAVVVTVQGLVALTSIVIIIYFIVKRVKEKREETFEKRDN